MTSGPLSYPYKRLTTLLTIVLTTIRFILQAFRWSSGMDLELITRKAQGDSYATPLLFVHGAWHGAWCWDEHFLPYFAEQGFDAHALSFRIHGKSESVGQLRWKRAADYVADV